MQRSSMAAKRIRRCSNKHTNKGGNFSEDRISLLQDDIIILILSFLSLKDSVVTSLLSRRWRHMWAFTSRLDFVGRDWSRTKELACVKKCYSRYWSDTKEVACAKKRYSRFVKGVNQVLRLHKASTVEEFRVSFDLNENFKCKIDNWLKFALAKRVQKLELDFHFPDSVCCDRKSKSYTMSYGMFGANWTSLKRLSANFCSIDFCQYVGFESLKVLCLVQVDVTGEVLEGFLSSCPSLEKLSVTYCKGLGNFKVHGPSLVLKYLEIRHCEDTTSVEICNVNLVTLIYRGPKISWVLQNAPMLVELTIGGRASLSLNELFTQLSCCLSQLETLTLKTSHRKEFEAFNAPLEFSNLKKLVLLPNVWGDISFLGYTWLIKASPLLQRFVLQAQWVSPTIGQREIRRVEKFLHQHIEEVELGGYYGSQSDLELVMFFLENAVSLKKITVDPRTCFEDEWGERILEGMEGARHRAMVQLEGKILQGIELKIL